MGLELKTFTIMEDIHSLYIFHQIFAWLKQFFLLIDCLFIFNYMYIPYNNHCLFFSVRFVISNFVWFPRLK